MNDVLEFYIHLGKSISKNAAGYDFEKQIYNEGLDDFGTVFCNVLNERYRRDSLCWQKGITISFKNYNIYIFGFGPEGEIHEVNSSDFVKELPDLVGNEMVNNTGIYKRIFRIYQHVNKFDCVFLIKPNSKRYWLKSIAVRDADDTIWDLQKEGF